MEKFAQTMREVGMIPTMLALIGVLLLWCLVLDAIGRGINRLRTKEESK